MEYKEVTRLREKIKQLQARIKFEKAQRIELEKMYFDLRKQYNAFFEGHKKDDNLKTDNKTELESKEIKEIIIGMNKALSRNWTIRTEPKKEYQNGN